jgi:broad specificity phosphatase PhoE
MRLVLIRHGETLWNAIHKFQGISDIELSPKGITQARSLAASLKSEGFSAIYSSPLKRARQTAEIIAEYHECPLTIEEGLKEINLGQLEGLTGEDLRRDFPDFFKNWMQDPGRVPMPQGESLKEVQERAWSAIEKMARKNAGVTVLAVAHSFVNLTIISRILELPFNQLRRLRQDATAKNVIEFSERGAVVHCLNDTCHMVENS